MVILLVVFGGVIVKHGIMEQQEGDKAMRKHLPTIVAFPIAAVLFFGARAEAGQTLIRIGIPEALDNPIGVMSEEIKEKAESRSGGRITVEVYPSNQLGGPREMLEGVHLGTLEVTVCTPSDLGNFIPQMSVLAFPFLFKDRAQAYRILDGEIGDELSEYARKGGFEVLGYPEVGFRQILNSVRPITKLEDFQGIKIRLPGNPVRLAAFRALGANPVSISFAECYSALQQRVCDGLENSPTNLYFNKFYEVTKFMSMTGILYDAFAITMNKEIYDEMPADLQEILKTACKEAIDNQRKLNSEMDDKSVQEIAKFIPVNELEPAEADRIAEKARSVYSQFENEIGKELIEKVLKAVQ